MSTEQMSTNLAQEQAIGYIDEEKQLKQVGEKVG